MINELINKLTLKNYSIFPKLNKVLEDNNNIYIIFNYFNGLQLNTDIEL